MLPTLLLTLSLSQAESPAPVALRLPAQIQAQPGQPFAVVAEGTLKWKRWTVPSGLVRVPPELTKAGDNGFVGYGPAGVYEFKVEGTLNDVYSEAKCVVFVGQPTPVPGPGPVPVPPNDPLAAELQLVFNAAGKPTLQRDRLTRLWRDAAADVLENDERKTLSDFREAMHEASKKHPYKLEATDLVDARKKLGEDLKALCGGVESCPLGLPKSELRAKFHALLERYSAALGAAR